MAMASLPPNVGVCRFVWWLCANLPNKRGEKGSLNRDLEWDWNTSGSAGCLCNSVHRSLRCINHHPISNTPPTQSISVFGFSYLALAVILMNSRVGGHHGHICRLHSEVCCCIVVLFYVGVKAFIKNRIACKLDSSLILLCLAFVRQSTKLQQLLSPDGIVALDIFSFFFIFLKLLLKLLRAFF